VDGAKQGADKHEQREFFDLAGRSISWQAAGPRVMMVD
jgi:hypothetical protein